MPHYLQENIIDFHKKFDCTIGDPANPDVSNMSKLRCDLIAEEYQELQMALAGYELDRKTGEVRVLTPEQKLHAIAKETADLVYVLVGSNIAWGIPFADCFEAVHASNMSKTPGNARADGKILKGPDYREADISGAFARAREDLEEVGYGDDSFWPEPRHISPRDYVEAASREEPVKVSIVSVNVPGADPDRFVFDMLKKVKTDQDPGDENAE